MSETFEKRGQRLIRRRDRLTTLYFTGKFEWALWVNCFSYGQKMDPSMDFSAPTAVSEKSIFLKSL